MTGPAGLTLQLPDGQHFDLRHLVLDYNGTLARDGRLIWGVAGKLRRLQKILSVEVLTADSFGTAQRTLDHRDIRVVVIHDGGDKARRVEELGASHVIAIGNGRNDLEMLRAAALSISVLGPEGAAAQLLASSMLVMPTISAALNALLHPSRLTASLRS